MSTMEKLIEVHKDVLSKDSLIESYDEAIGILKDCWQIQFASPLNDTLPLITFFTIAKFIPANHEDCLDILKRKRNDYGKDVFEFTGLSGIIVRLLDKFARLQNLNGKEGMVEDESLQDTINDIYNYCILGIDMIGRSREKIQNLMEDDLKCVD